MRLALSSAAAPDAALADLLDAAARRGLSAVELVDGHGHGVGAAPGTAAEAARAAAARGLALAGFRLSQADAPGTSDAPSLARLARDLAAPILVPFTVGAAGGRAADDAVRLASAIREADGDAMVVLPSTGVLEALEAVPPDAAVAWDADPTRGDLAGPGAGLLERAGSRLRHVRLRGGGPEATEQEGRGIGSLMARLAVAGYAGTVALAPSSARYRVIWDAWLGRRGGWGCGSRAEDRTLVSLGGVE